MDNLLASKHYYGFDLLRIIMTFGVVLIHFWDGEGSGFLFPILRIIQTCAVPSFMILSLFLTQEYIIELDYKRLKKRLVRLAVPYLFWGLFNWIVMFVIERILHVNIIAGLRVLILQLLLGNGFHVNAPLWYLNSLIVITILFASFFKIFGKKGGFIAVSIATFSCIVFQYTEAVYRLIEGWPFETKYPIGRLQEMIPFAAIGLIISFLKDGFTEKKDKNKMFAFVSIVIIIAYTIFKGYLYTLEGFGYQGIVLIVASTAIFILFLLFNPAKLCESKLFRIVCRHTLGIYCIHYLVGHLFGFMLERINVSINSVLFCVLVYFISYIVSDVISQIPIKGIKLLVD